METAQLFAYFDNYLPLGKKEREDLGGRVKERKIRRKQFILQKDDLCRHYTFVISGCLKMYGVDQNDAEHNIQFAAENDWIFDIASFHSNNGSLVYIQAIEPSVILQIERSDLIHLFAHYKNFNINFRVLAENKFAEVQNRLLHNLTATAEERYLAFLAQYPHLSNRLPNTQIASYIGITPEFLSKVRSNISKK
jgi:CRP-like cAMP-binding protein